MRFVSAAGLKLMKKNAPLGGLRMKSLMPKVLWTSVLLSGLVTACGGSSGRRGGGGPDSQLTSLKIGSMGGEWVKMDVSFESVSRKNPFQKYEFQKADFKQDGVENVNIVVKQDEYYIDLNYFDQQNKLLMRSCPESKSYKHNMVGKSEYKTNIDVCTIGSETPVGSVEVSGEAHVTITPVPKTADQAKTPAPASGGSPDPQKPVNTPSGSNFAGKIPKDAKFWVDPYSQAMNSAKNLKASGDSRASLVDYIAQQGAAVWYGEWSGSDIRQAVSRQIQGARETGSWAVMIAYNIPHRDCGQHSAGGLAAKSYQKWISDMAEAIGDAKAIVVLEPDAIPLQRCLTDELKAERNKLLKEAVKKFKSHKNTLVYLDAGHSNFLTVEEIAPRLKAAGIDEADGFALNTSNYQTTESNVDYGVKVSQLLGGKSFVIDTSRNGNGPKGDQWCNPRGRALGKAPTAQTGIAGVDAYLWLKRPGESDGFCENGGDNSPMRYDVPAAGNWWLDIAVEQARNAGMK